MAFDVRSRVAAGPFYYGWVVAVACFLTAAVVFGATYSFGVFFDALVADFAASRATLSLVFGLQTFVLYVGAAALGGLIDRYGVRPALVVGALLLGAGLVGTSQSTDLLGLFLAYGVVAALGMSALYVVAYATVPRWFGRRRGFANGLATSGLGVGVFFAAPAATWLIDRVDWRMAYVVFAAVFVAVLLVAALFAGDGPADVGADTSAEFPAGYEPGSERDGDGIADGNGDDEGPYADEADGTDGGLSVSRVLTIVRTPGFLLVLGGWILVYSTLYLVLTHLILYATDVGFGRALGALAVSVVGGTTTLARLGLGFVSDRVGRVRLFVGCSLGMAVSTGLMAFAGTPALLVALGVAFGICYGGNGALLSPLVADLFGREGLSTTYGLLSVSFAVAGLLTPYLAARGREALGTYTPVFVVVAAAGILGAGLIAAGGHYQGEL